MENQQPKKTFQRRRIHRIKKRKVKSELVKEDKDMPMLIKEDKDLSMLLKEDKNMSSVLKVEKEDLPKIEKEIVRESKVVNQPRIKMNDLPNTYENIVMDKVGNYALGYMGDNPFSHMVSELGNKYVIDRNVPHIATKEVTKWANEKVKHDYTEDEDKDNKSFVYDMIKTAGLTYGAGALVSYAFPMIGIPTVIGNVAKTMLMAKGII